MKLSVVIPAYNEEASLPATVEGVVSELDEAGIDHEVLIVDDASEDDTERIGRELAGRFPTVRYMPSDFERGFGYCVRSGLAHYEGDAVTIFMADQSDDPADLVKYFNLLQSGADCVFGSRFISGSKVTGYPALKRVINRAANLFIRLLFLHGYNDTTNAFKAYRREVIDTVAPLVSNHFNLTVELPLKAVVRGYDFEVVPINWSGRTKGTSKLSMREMGSRYGFIVLYVWLEKHLSRGDYLKASPPGR